MKKIFTTLAVLSTLFFSGCNSSSTKSIANNINDTTEHITKSMVEPTPYEIISSNKYPVSEQAYTLETSQVKAYHSDSKEEVSSFENEYKELTGKEYENPFDGTMIVAKAGVRNSSNYTIRVEEVNDSGRYTQIFLSVTKSEGCLTSQVLTSPYIITFVPNHKEVKYTIENKTIDCK